MNELFDLRGKKAIVTGGGKGVGEGITNGLAMAGAKVLIIGSSPQTAELAGHLSVDGKDVKGLQGDLSRLENIPSLFDQSMEMLDGLDILVNNAAIQVRQPAMEFSLADWQRVIDVNVSASFFLCQCAAKQMIPKKYGKIINIASMTSFFGSYNVAAYAASKGAVAQMTKSLSNEWAPLGINVNAVAPGGFKTEMTKALWSDPKTDEMAMERTPAGRWGTASDIMGSIIFLASHASDYVCGAILPVDGGYLAR